MKLTTIALALLSLASLGLVAAESDRNSQQPSKQRQIMCQHFCEGWNLKNVDTDMDFKDNCLDRCLSGKPELFTDHLIDVLDPRHLGERHGGNKNFMAAYGRLEHELPDADEQTDPLEARKDGNNVSRSPDQALHDLLDKYR